MLITTTVSLFITPDPESIRPKGSAARAWLHLPPRAWMLALLGPAGALQTQLSSISLLGASRKIWGVSPFHGVTGGPTPGVLSLLSLAWAASPGEVYMPQASLATERARSVQPKSSIYRPGQKPRSQKPSATTPTSAHIPHRRPPWKRPEAVEAVSD